MRKERMRINPRPGRPPAGFTLVEILVSLVVLAIGSLAALSMQTSTMENGSQAYQMTTAAFLAESEIEHLQSLTCQQVASTAAAPINLTQDGQACPADGSRGPCFIRTVRVAPSYPTSLSVGVSVEVRAPGPGPARSLVYDTILTYYNFGECNFAP